MPVEHDNRVWHVYGVDVGGDVQCEGTIFWYMDSPRLSWFQLAEKYEPGQHFADGTSGPPRATELPKTGIDLIDLTQPRASDAMMACGQRPRF